RCRVFLGPLETHCASAVVTCQSGVPGIEYTAAGVIVDISRFTPGVLTPGGGVRGPRPPPFFSAAGGASCANAKAVIPATPIVKPIRPILMFLRVRVSLLRKRRRHSLGIELRHLIPRPQPHRPQRRLNHSGAIAPKLLHDLLAGRIDPRQRK